MNYSSHYDRLINRARGRVLEGYRERHHVLPRCMGGSNESANIVELTAEEHYVAHQLLVKIYPGVGALAHAANVMAKQCSGSRAYGWLRRRHARAIASNTAAHAKGAAKRRKPLSQKHKDAIRAAMRKPEMVEFMASVQRGRKRPPRPEEWCNKLSLALRGNTCGANSQRMKGQKHSEETKAKLSAARIKYLEQRRGAAC